jgi:hypothetical protein
MLETKEFQKCHRPPTGRTCCAPVGWGDQVRFPADRNAVNDPASAGAYSNSPPLIARICPVRLHDSSEARKVAA